MADTPDDGPHRPEDMDISSVAANFHDARASRIGAVRLAGTLVHQRLHEFDGNQHGPGAPMCRKKQVRCQGR
jgi:hypothetical protein